MDKPSNIDRMIDRMEERHLEHYHKKIDLIKKIKEYLEDEVEPTDEQGELVEQYDESTSDIHRGRSELAENLLNQINKWEQYND